MTESKPVRVSILDKEYLISCPDDEREQLYAVVDFVNEKLLEVKGSGKLIGTERIVIMATLNIANELLAYKRKNKDYTESVDSIVKRLQTKIDGVLVGDE